MFNGRNKIDDDEEEDHGYSGVSSTENWLQRLEDENPDLFENED